MGPMNSINPAQVPHKYCSSDYPRLPSTFQILSSLEKFFEIVVGGDNKYLLHLKKQVLTIVDLRPSSVADYAFIQIFLIIPIFDLVLKIHFDYDLNFTFLALIVWNLVHN